MEVGRDSGAGGRSGVPASTGAGFRERLGFGPAGWVIAALGAVGIVIALIPVAPAAAIAAGAAVLLATLALNFLGSPVVAVQGGELRAGKAHIPLRLLGEPEVLDAAATRQALGPGLDARAHVCLRGWIRTGVVVPVADPRDPTPYWFVSTRRPDELADAIRAG